MSRATGSRLPARVHGRLPDLPITGGCLFRRVQPGPSLQLRDVARHETGKKAEQFLNTSKPNVADQGNYSGRERQYSLGPVSLLLLLLLPSLRNPLG